jgi:hypothetical protein
MIKCVLIDFLSPLIHRQWYRPVGDEKDLQLEGFNKAHEFEVTPPFLVGLNSHSKL